MYLTPSPSKTILFRWYFCTLLILCFNTLYSQKKKAYSDIYAKEFKQLKNILYNKKLISLSEIIPDKAWNNYKGGNINTEDSLFCFNDDFLSNSFPTNSDKISNQYLAFYFSQKSQRCPTLFSLLNYYYPIIEKNLNSNDLPQELKLLPVVCSAFNPYSSNDLGGEGYWHLNYPQAIKYGLIINKDIDERRDFKKATKAAVLYIKDLYRIYNNWELTLAAYSSGVTTVKKLLNRHAAKTYKEIYPYLPDQTKNLVQAFVAMNYIYYYDSYGAVRLTPIIEVDTLQINRRLNMSAINHVIKTSNDEFKFLNPTLNKDVFPSNFCAYFPKGKKAEFINFEDSIYFYQDSILDKPEFDTPEIIIPKDGETFVYTVKSGDFLGGIAERFNVRVSQLQSWNSINGTRINIGQKITVYNKKKIENPTINIPEEKKQTTQTPEKGFQSNYTVKFGDNLSTIAKKFSGISAQNIQDYNNIDANLNIGQVLKIPKK